MLVPPSPKSHDQLVLAHEDVSVNCTLSGTDPFVGLAPKLAHDVKALIKEKADNTSPLARSMKMLKPMSFLRYSEKYGINSYNNTSLT